MSSLSLRAKIPLLAAQQQVLALYGDYFAVERAVAAAAGQGEKGQREEQCKSLFHIFPPKIIETGVLPD